MLLEVLNIGKLELFAGMPLVQLMSLKWGSPLGIANGPLAMMIRRTSVFFEDTQTAEVSESVAVLLLLLACSLTADDI